MVALAKTINEAITQILRRIGKASNTTWQTIALEHLNDALEFVGGEHDWKFLRKKSTATTSDATGVLSLPSDCDRVLAIYESGSDIMLQELDAFQFAMEKEAGDIVSSKVYTTYGFSQDTDIYPPLEQIEIYTAPAASTTYQIYYVKRLDELTASDTVPNIPPRIWNTVYAKALMETLITQEQPAQTIATAERHFVASLTSCKRAEKYGSSKYGSIRLGGSLSNHLKTRFTDNA